MWMMPLAFGQSWATGDSRSVSQPSFPSVCETLSAAGTTSSGSDQTSAITAALSSCAGKGSVVLASSGSNNAFWTKGFSMSSNETLVINSGVTLEGNGYSSQLINPSGSNISIMGPGAINGRSSSGNRLINTGTVDNFIVYDVNLENAGKMQLYVQGGSGVTIWDVYFGTTATTTNADGIDLDSLSNATVYGSYINAGDDCVAVKTNNAAASNITVKDSTCHGTHGLSIGSQTFKGVSNIYFDKNYVYGYDQWGNDSTYPAAIRIKTDPTCGGTVNEVYYENTCITQAKELIWLDTQYGSCSGTAGTPWFKNIIIDGVKSQDSQSDAGSRVWGYSSSTVMTLWLQNIDLDVTTYQYGAQYADIGEYNTNLAPSGTGVSSFSTDLGGSVPSCSF
jgi:polygalacturonase